MNYYNEYDAGAAAWLRELTRGVHTSFVVATFSILTQSRGISYDQLVRDRLDTEPTPSRAICSFWSYATVRYAQSPVYAPHQERAIPHSSHTHLGHQDCIGGIAKDWSQAVASPLFADDTLILSRGCEDGTLSLISPLWRVGKHRSRSIFDFDPGELGKSFRNACTHVRLRGWDDVSTEKRPNTSESRIYHPSEQHGVCYNAGKY